MDRDLPTMVNHQLDLKAQIPECTMDKCHLVICFTYKFYKQYLKVFCPASGKKAPKGPLVTKHGGHVEYMWAIKKAISITHF